ncbi:MAG: hypothetical protein K0A89_06865, partial [ANME-2 cluster archaeon]|nr:hypothetical protein [ANME-2 cluster archaeon]
MDWIRDYQKKYIDGFGNIKQNSIKATFLTTFSLNKKHQSPACYTGRSRSPPREACRSIPRAGMILAVTMLIMMLFAGSASAAVTAYYWEPSSGAIDASGYTADWGACNARPTAYRVTTLNDVGLNCADDRLTTTTTGDQFLAIFPIAYTVQTQVTGQSGANFYLRERTSIGPVTYRFELGYAQSGAFTSFGFVDQVVPSGVQQAYVVDMSSISGGAPANSYLALKVSVASTSGEQRIYMGTSNSNSGQFSVDEVAGSTAPTYNVTVTPSPTSAGVVAGGSTEYTITVNNNGNTDGNYSLSAVDSDPTNFGSSLGTTTLAVLSGGSAQTTLNVTNGGAGTSDTTTVTATSVEDPANFTGSGQVITTVIVPNPSVSVTLTPPSQNVAPGSQVSYTVTVQNTGNVADSYTLSLTNANTADFSYSLNSSTTGTLNPGQQSIKTMTVTASAGATGSHQQSVTATGSASDTSNLVTTTVFTGPSKILVATNRYVVLDDATTSGQASGTGFIVPSRTWTNAFGPGVRTTVNMYALVLDADGMPLPSSNVTLTLRNPGGAIDYTLPTSTDSNGLINVPRDLNAKNYYGKWQVEVNASGVTGSAQFIYNWWGCVGGNGCSGHGNENLGSGAPISSPYAGGSDAVVGDRSQHATTCTVCHLSYNGQGLSQSVNTIGAHSSLSCDNANCHGSISSHNTNMIIGSCTNCHSSANTTMKSTLNGIVSTYSTTSTYHSNPAIPCVICHGPMHNITKPDPSAGTLGPTEDSHCTTCHQGLTQHNTTVACTECHTQDVHVIKFIQNDNNFATTRTNAASCPDCHVGSGLASFATAPKITQITHSNNILNGTLWDRGADFWTASDDESKCLYCHGETKHSAVAAGYIASFKGANVMGGDLSGDWCSSCHKKGSTNYNDMLTTLSNVPPEITGDSLYGNYSTGAQDGTSYYDHSTISGFTDADCTECHKSTATEITPLMHEVKKASGMTCARCHAAYGTAVLSTQHNQSLNPGAPTCTDCHNDTGYGDLSHANGPKVYTVNETNTCRNCHIDGVNGFYERHTSSSDCTTCHFANTTQPFTLNASLYAHDHNLVVEHSYYEYNTSGGMPLALNGGTGVGMFPQYTCSLPCHATRSPEKVDLASRTWLNSSHANSRAGASDSKNNCAKCKSPTNYDVLLSALNPVIAEEDWDGIQCRVCHNLHDRKYPNNTGTSGAPIAFYNATASSYANYSVYDEISNNTELCEKCHQPGGSHDSKFAGPHRDTLNFTCTDCHMNASFSKGMHEFKVENITSAQTGCEVCHNPADHTFTSTALHTDKVDCLGCHDQMYTTANVTGYAVTADGNYGVWNDSGIVTTWHLSHGAPATFKPHNISRDVTCAKCHGAKSIVTDLPIAPVLSGDACASCHAAYGTAVLSTQHNQSLNPGAPTCTDCHNDTGYGDLSHANG